MADKQLFNDATNYHEMSKPLESFDAANAAINGFWDEFYALRNKYRLPDIHIIIRLVVEDGNGGGDVMVSMHAGNSMNEEAMTAWALGQAQVRRQENIIRIASEGKEIRKVKNRK